MDFRDDTEPADLLNSRHGVEEISDPACRLLNRPPGYLTFCLYAWSVVFPGTWLRYFAQEDVVNHDTAIVLFFICKQTFLQFFLAVMFSSLV